MTTASYSKDTLNALDPNLRTRYDDAFLRNELVNVRKQVDVLHDTMLSFMTRMEKRLTYQEGEQRKISNRLARLEQHCKIGAGFGSGSKSNSSGAANALEVEGASSGNKRRKSDTLSRLQSQLGNLPEGLIIHDEHGNQLGQIVTVDSTEGDALGSVTLIHVQETEEQAVEVQSETGEELTGEYSEEFAETETEPEPEPEQEQEPEGTDSNGLDSRVMTVSEGRRSLNRKPTTGGPGMIDWDRIEGESRTMLNLPERKGKGGKVSGRLGLGSPAWTHLLRKAICRSIGEEAMLRYAREGSRTFKMEQEDLFNEIKERVVNFCKKNNVAVPDDKLMDEIAWAFLRNKKRYRAKSGG